MTWNAIRKTTLAGIADFTNGGAWNQTEYSDEGIPVVRVTDIHDATVNLADCKFLPNTSLRKYAKHTLKAGDLIICTVGSHPTQPASVVGRAAIVPAAADGALLNQNAVRVRALSAEVDQRWLGYLGRSRAFQEYIISCARGSANQVRMAIGLLKEMPVDVPPLWAQRRIADTLSAYDDLIENNLHRIRNLEKTARGIYREWFVHFRFPDHERLQLVASSLGPIPQGWNIRPVESSCPLIVRGVTPKYQAGSGRFIINQKVNRGSELSLGDLKELETSLNVPEEKFARFGDVLVNCLGEGTIGRVHFYGERHHDWAVDQHMSICRAEGLTDSLYVYFALESPEGQERIASLKTGGTNMTMFNISALRAFALVQPPVTLRARFAELVIPMMRQRQVLTELTRNLRRTRDLLMPRLLSGQVKLDSN
jgi:type I restriction enzyme S subunit